MISELHIYYLLFVGLVATVSYWRGYKQGETDGVVDVVLEMMEDGQAGVSDEVNAIINSRKK